MMESTTLKNNRQAWRSASLALVLLIALVLVMYRDTGIAMVTIWARSETFTHAFLVPPISLWLVWRKRHELAAQAPRPCLWALLPLAACALLWLLGDLAAVNAVTQLAMTALIVLVVVTVIGWRAAWTIAFPLGFLFFAVPIGEFLLPQLMEWTANFTIIALRFSGIPVYRDGLQFVIPSGHWSVVEACSGVRYLIASLTVGTLFAYLNYESNGRRWIFVGISILVPIVANWMRAYMIVMLGHLSGNTLAVGVDHLIYGWLFFGIVIMAMFMIGAKWAETPAEPAAPALANRQAPHTAATVMSLMVTTVIAAGIVGMPQLIEWKTNTPLMAEMPQLTAPEVMAAGWRIDPNASSTFKPSFHNASRELMATYGKDAEPVTLYIAYYRNQNYERKLVSSDNVLVTSKDAIWAQSSSGQQTVTVGGEPLQIRTADLRQVGSLGQAEDTRLAVWQFYWLNGRLTSSDYLAKAYSAWHRLTGQGDDAAVIVVSTQARPPGHAQEKLQLFMHDNFQAIDALLHKLRNEP